VPIDTAVDWVAIDMEIIRVFEDEASGSCSSEEGGTIEKSEETLMAALAL
jgi:hypothetical protein